MVRTSGGLPVKEDDRMSTACWMIAVDPHISLLAVLDPAIVNTHHFYRCFVGVDHGVFVDQLMQTVIQQRKIRIRTPDHPVGHGVG